MPVKYHCPKCNKRFVEWGAEKLGFKCPDCKNEELVRVGVAEDRPMKRPTLKRGTRKAAPIAPVVEEDEALVPDTEVLEEEEEVTVEEEPAAFVPVSAEEAEVEFVPNPDDLVVQESTEAEEVELEVPDDLAFGEVAPPLDEEPVEEQEGVEEEWPQ
ncbi:MAG: hypothetical protein HY706_01595 [Candidatus Hydrogenedentes bacterium]|nr:hypothetical protein [Candidatus Hydrogenedentota bacterium]